MAFTFFPDLLYHHLKSERSGVNSTVTDTLCIPSNPVFSGYEWSLKGFCQSHVVCMCVYGLGLCTVTGDQQVCDF